MLSSAVVSVVSFVVFACGVVSATGSYDWIDMLPECLQDCLDTSNGCDSARCICKASQHDGYLASAMSCARDTCDEDEFSPGLFLSTLESYCSMVGKDIPYPIISAAECAATETSKAPQPTPTNRGPASQKSQAHSSMSKGNDLTRTLTKTITQTTTDSNGATLQLIIPVIMGPNTMSYGSTITSTLGGEASSTDAPSNTAASPSPTAAPSAPPSTPAQQGQVGSSTTSSQKAGKTSSGNNGSPFENMQAGAGRWELSGAVICMSVLAGVFMRL
ncbi:hypothetical protein BCR34DRAFT_605600 [Clohesyomyces aquaticus]|uniref:Uncharacterized protein n=1 Tax=Clohesyomyces aquaticus TaxID=1231657 RepID=A0A1Y1YWJ4_9PLEO|nr:hypothetical protein BCR34DRAFT_605600 [Clohesyomyces aquaticus]